MTDWVFGYAPEHWMMANFTDLVNASYATKLSQTNKQTGLTISQAQFNALVSGLPWHNLDKELLTPLT